ncbi:MAG: hypothetical protein FJ202_04860 [Gemmatimonadetes bacterium]|nr:hypothetical protein [Gemmatimonadota bacterium]
MSFNFHDLAITDAGDGVRVITLTRNAVKNALRHQTMVELADALGSLDSDSHVRCVVITGGPSVFAAGADLAEMLELDGPALEQHPRTLAWRRIWEVGCPIVAAVEGWALGGGCELALSCDVVIAGDGARFGQPEITLGWMPGAGGTQRLARSAGKSVAMQMVLTGDAIDAAAAQRAGIVSEVVAAGSALARAVAVAARIAAHPRGATRAAKAAVQRAFETPLRDGLRDEHAGFRTLASSDERNTHIREAITRSRAKSRRNSQ